MAFRNDYGFVYEYTYQDIIRTILKKSSSAEVCRGCAGARCSIDFSPDAKHLSWVEKSAFTDILGKAAWSPGP